jgi:hypothetical protein
VVAGTFRSDALRAQVAITPGGCIDLCTLLKRLVDGVVVEEEGGGYSVVIVKHSSGAGA